MASVKEHYDQLLAGVYSWMFGGFERGLEINTEFFDRHNVRPRQSGVAIDLGAGCGFQSIPLAKAGFSVLAIDLDVQLIGELQAHSGELDIRAIRDDLIDFDRHQPIHAELIVCMTDTLIHLESREKVVSLIRKVFAALEDHGKFILTFRDLSSELVELDRFIPMRNDENTVLTCFLEYEPEAVKVHDLVYRREGKGWSLSKSFYRKLRLSQAWVEAQLAEAGFSQIESGVESGFVTIIAGR